MERFEKLERRESLAISLDIRDVEYERARVSGEVQQQMVEYNNAAAMIYSSWPENATMTLERRVAEVDEEHLPQTEAEIRKRIDEIDRKLGKAVYSEAENEDWLLSNYEEIETKYANRTLAIYGGSIIATASNLVELEAKLGALRDERQLLFVDIEPLLSSRLNVMPTRRSS